MRETIHKSIKMKVPEFFTTKTRRIEITKKYKEAGRAVERFLCLILSLVPSWRVIK
jgi:hypothetical protein